jgi:hypothetical protein
MDILKRWTSQVTYSHTPTRLCYSTMCQCGCAMMSDNSHVRPPEHLRPRDYQPHPATLLAYFTCFALGNVLRNVPVAEEGAHGQESIEKCLQAQPRLHV